jgi:hypothetical protein
MNNYSPRELTRADQRRRLAAAERVAFRLLARVRQPGVRFASERVAEAIGRIEWYGRGR